MIADAVAKQAGQRIALLHKRIGDARPYVIDCAELLQPHELLLGLPLVDAPALHIGLARTRQGRWLEVHISGGEVATNKSHADHALTATIPTTRGIVALRIDVRVHAQ